MSNPIETIIDVWGTNMIFYLNNKKISLRLSYALIDSISEKLEISPFLVHTALYLGYSFSVQGTFWLSGVKTSEE